MNKQLFGMDMENVEEENLSSEDDSSDDNNEVLEQRAEEIERELSNNVYLYDLHKELVNICEKTGDLPSLRLAYDRFAKTFPLTEELWLKWINVEISVADEDKKNIMGIFERATKDYLSVKLWLEYVQFAMSHCELNETHAILENALSVAGLHYTDASLLWDILRELEIAHLSVTPKDSEAYKTQLHKLVDAFKRQLSVPLLNIGSTYDEWQQFIEQVPEIDASIVEPGYKKALECVENYKVYEEKILMTNDDQELIDVYSQYIKSIKNPSLIICLYERSIEKVCLVPQVWIDYINYTLKLGDVSLGVTERALRNVTWCDELWCLRLKVLEKFEEPVEEVTKCFENSLFHIPTGLDLWLDFVAFTKRNNPDNLMKLLDQAEEQQIADPTFKVTRYHAFVCAKIGAMERARELWNALLLDPQVKTSSQFWLEYVRLERQYGTVLSARGVFNRAITCNTDWPQGIADEWTSFERDEGTLEDVLKSHDKINKILPQKLKAQAAAQSHAQVVASDHAVKETKNRKRKSDSEVTDDHAQWKKPKPEMRTFFKNQGPPPDLDPTKSVFISNLSPTVTQAQLSVFFPTGKVTLATNNKGSSRCFGYVQFECAEDAEAALARDRTHFESRPIFISKCKTEKTERQAAFKFSQNAEENKLFVKGLPVKFSQADVENLFKPYNCKEVRVVVHKSGQSKGLAYVEFEKAADAAKAMQATNNTTVENFIISVAISAPPSKDVKLTREAPVRHSKSRLQVPLIPRAALKRPIQEQSENGAGGNSAGKVLPKSNSDFRNMLLNK